MSKRTDYFKRLFTKVSILFYNMGENERKEANKFIDAMSERRMDEKLLVDDANLCKCKKRSDVLSMNNKNYCVDCLRVIKEKK